MKTNPPSTVQAQLLHIHQYGVLTVPKKGFWRSRWASWVTWEEVGLKKTMYRLFLTEKGRSWCQAHTEMVPATDP
jgi:hypothetical protein